MFKQLITPFFPNARYAVQLRFDHRLCSLLTMERYCEAMHLILNTLQQIKLLTITHERHNLWRISPPSALPYDAFHL